MKDVYYFPHDYNARTDPKLQDLLMSHGVAGIGIYWCVVEQLYEQGGRLPLSSVRSIAFALHCDSAMVEDVILNHGLFQTDGASFWSESAERRIAERNAIREAQREGARKAMQKRWAKAKGQDSDSGPTGDLSETNKSVISNLSETDKLPVIRKEIKGKESKKNEIKDNNDVPSVSRFQKPTIQMVSDFISEKGYTVDAVAFWNYYESNGWRVGKNPMKNWKAAIANWQRMEKERNYGKTNSDNRLGFETGSGGAGESDFQSTI